jgi:hypothetical protein
MSSKKPDVEVLLDDHDALDGVEDPDEDVPYRTVGERKVLIQQYDYAVRTLIDMITEGELVLDPDYQRHYRWPDEKASRFIESIALNIPVPVLYMAEEADGTFSVIDGQQRLTSLFRYFRPTELENVFPGRNFEELVLKGLKVRNDMDGKAFHELDRVDKSVLAKRPIRCIVVLNESDSTLKFEVFERLNTGSASLTDQEVRNCIYRGAYNNLLKKLATNAKFHELISLPEKTKHTMKDVELVLRFFAYRDLKPDSDYSDNFAEYLNDHMQNHRELSEASAAELEALFVATVDTLYDTLGTGIAFRKPSDRDAPLGGSFAQGGINGAIYESQMVAVSKLVELSGTRPSDLRDKIVSAFKDDSYWGTLFQGTSKKTKALARSRILGELISPKIP